MPGRQLTNGNNHERSASWIAGSQPALLSLAVAVAFLLAIPVQATTFVPPRDLGELALESDLVVLARAVTSESRKRGSLIFTDTDFEVEEDLAGGLVAGHVLRVQFPGGEVDGEIWAISGVPSFKDGESYLLCLTRKSDELWLPSIISYGTFRRDPNKGGGSALLVPIPELEHGMALARPDGNAAEALSVYYEDALVDHLRGILAGRELWDSSAVGAPGQLNALARKAPPNQCVFFTSSGRSFRWRTFDSGGRATMYADAAGDQSLTNGGFDLVSGAMDLWMDITDSSVNLAYGGPREVSFNCASQDSANNVIVFNDPCSDIGTLQGCSGTLAFGGPRASGTHSFDGATWVTITGWIVVVNDGTGCLGENNYQRMLAHELGHGLGFGHVSDSNALMFANCCRNVNSTDRTCLRYTYPAIDAANERPSVDAGSDQVVSLARNTIRLRGSVSDDGIPTSPGAVTTTWVALQGPGEVNFADASAAETSATLSQPGSYLLGLQAFDGQLLSTDTITLDADLWAGSSAVASFQQRVAGYAGTVDTQLSQNEPSLAFGTATAVGVDGDDPNGSGLDSQVLLRFDDLFGSDSSQISPGSTIYAAWLEVETTNDGDGATVRRMLEEWSQDATWESFGGNGIQAGSEASAAVDSTVTGADGVVRVDVTSSLAAWSETPCENFGWAMLPQGDDGWDFSSSESTAPPKLVVVYSLVSEETVIEIGDEWRYFKGRTEPDPDWTLPEFNPDASWFSGETGIGFGDGDDTTVLTDMRGEYASIFCRRTFPVVSPETLGRLSLRIDYDDGFVAYLNGEEVARSASMGAPGTPVNRNTLPDSRESGTFEEHSLDLTNLRAGTNVLAIQVHNATVSSTDLSFVPELRALPDVVDEGATWKFLRGSTTIPNDWNQTAFDDSAWESGPTGIGFGDGDDATELTDMRGQYVSVFFRRIVELRNLPLIDEVLLTVIYDDGVAVYVNGTEVGRANLAAGTIGRLTPASTNGETEVATFAIPKELLVEGENLIAASVHNASLSSSDFSFVPVLVARRATARSVFCGTGFLRGDANDDGHVDLGDAVKVLFHAFKGDLVPCADAADPNDDGVLDQSDAVHLLTYLFQAGPAPADPGIGCGQDPTDDALGDCVTVGCSG